MEWVVLIWHIFLLDPRKKRQVSQQKRFLGQSNYLEYVLVKKIQLMLSYCIYLDTEKNQLNYH